MHGKSSSTVAQSSPSPLLAALFCCLFETTPMKACQKWEGEREEKEGAGGVPAQAGLFLID